MPSKTLEQKFWERVDRRGDDDCWEWTGTRRNDYGRFRVGSRTDNSRRMLTAHRFAYEALVGPIPEGMKVCHRCDNPPCCNPAHLFVGSQGDNMLDMYAKDRHIRCPPRYVPPIQDPKPCADCGRLAKPLRRGRCSRCYGFWWRAAARTAESR